MKGKTGIKIEYHMYMQMSKKSSFHCYKLQQHDEVCSVNNDFLKWFISTNKKSI